MSSTASEDRDLIFIEKESNDSVVHWYVIYAPASNTAILHYPPGHPFRTVCLMAKGVRYNPAHVIQHGPEGLAMKVIKWVHIWKQSDILSMLDEDVRNWAKKLCLEFKHWFQRIDNPKEFYENNGLDPLTHSDRNQAVRWIRQFYPDFTPHQWHFREENNGVN